MITIYHVEERRSERVVWLMEELGLPYELVFVNGDLLGSLKKITEQHPLGYAPTVRDGDIVLVESGAILEYIMARYGGGRLSVPPESADYPHYVQWFHLAEGSVAFRLIVEFIIHGFGPNPDKKSPMASHLRGGARKIMDLAESAVASRPYFGGQAFTAADIMMHFCVRMARLWKMDFSAYPAMTAWYEKVTQRPAFKRMCEVSLPNGTTTGLIDWGMEASDW
jgi:glutathione S-transferase